MSLPAAQRHWLPLQSDTTCETPFQFVAMTYNVLAQCLIQREMYPYASKQALRWAFRCKNILKEIETVNPDVLALQECDQFAQTWKPRLDALGYVTHYLTKDAETESSSGHGCLIAFKKSVFELTDSTEVFLSKLAEEYQDECTIAEFRRQNIAQIVALQCIHKPQLGVIVSNTHLFWNPKFPFVRVRQCERVLRSALQLQSLHSHFPLLLLGDWNITPDSVPYRFLTTRHALDDVDMRCLLTPLDHAAAVAAKQAARLNGDSEQARAPQRDIDQIATWTAEDFRENFPALNDPNSQQRRQEVESFIQSASVELPVLRSVYSDYQSLKVPSTVELEMPQRWSGEPLFTNYAASWNGTLDYLFINSADGRLLPVSVLELPDVSELSVQVALPNDKFASDHVCLAATFRLSDHPVGTR